jgi:hypothetical protein
MNEILNAPYEPPTVSELGSFEDLTRATNLGEDTDVALPYAATASLATIS